MFWRAVLAITLSFFAWICVSEPQADGRGGRLYHDGSLRADIVLYNGKIYTMDPDDRVVSVVAIKDGKVVYVGSNERDARRQFVDAPKTINLNGRMALPGLIDAHNHIVLMGNRPGYHVPLENAYTIADVQETLRARADETPAGEFITTIGGFHPNQFSETRLPNLEELDEAVPDYPVFIMVGFFGPSVTNSKGKEILEASDPAPEISANGSIPAGGFASGGETGKALFALRQRLTFEDRKRGVMDAMKYSAEMGVTTHLDQGAFQMSGTPNDGSANEDNFAMHLPWMSVYDDGEGIVRLRINFIHMDASIELPTLKQRLLNTFKFFGNDMVRTGGIGEFIAADSTGGPVFEEAARIIAEAGWRVEVHSLSDTDFQTQITAFEKINAEHSIKDLRWVVAHVPQITSEWLQRLKDLGGGVSLTSYQYLAGVGPNAGPPLKDIVESGIRAGYGADGMQIAPLNPWVHMYFAVTGKNARGDQINEGQQISRKEVLQMYTRANQWFLGGPDEELLGAIEVGRLGDIIVLNEDYFEVPDEDLKKLRSVLTVVGGEVVHDTLSE